MLENTFLHIPGIGIKAEQQFWSAGIRTWKDLTSDCPVRLSPSKMDTVKKYLAASAQHLISGNPSYFSKLLTSGMHWRFFPEFRNETVYLDIETTGLETWKNEITTIAMYNGNSITYYVNGRNLENFLDDIKKYKVIVTYNGKCFDVPFIERYFSCKLNQVHIDLRYVLASLGYKGGLKGCEVQLGIDRGDLKGMDGFFAVLLWQDYQLNQNQKALETLLAYNIQDVLTLEALMIMAYNLKIRHTPFFNKQLPEPVLPAIPFGVDTATIEKLKKGQA